LVGKPQVKRPLVRSRHRCEDNIKIEVRLIGCEDADWLRIGLIGGLL
jgi:hypothetical protein